MPDRVTEYALNVASGNIKGCGLLHKLACQRHLNDLQRQNTTEFPYYWDNNAANDVINFAETLTVIEGTAARTVNLIDSQAFDIGCTFGWEKSKNGNRRFRRRYKSVARQNGKTFENGILGSYIAGFDGYKYGKLFTVATKKRQARLAWEEMAKFIKADDDLAELFEIKDYNSLIKAVNTNCTIEALSREAGLDDGFRAIFASIDEIHQHKDNKIYKAIYNGTRSLPQTLISMITTRGDRLNSFCKEMDDYAIKILQGVATAEDFFVDIYCLDDNDDIWNEENWKKANPFICLDEERFNTLRQDAQTARDMGGQDLADFLTKCLNMWVRNTDKQYINPDDWKACASKRTIADVVQAGLRNCYVGIDLSSGGDLTTFSLLFPMPTNKFYIYSHSFMPLGRLDEHKETDLAPYDLWERDGLITVTGGENDFMNDYKFIISELAELKQRYELNFLAIGIDPHNAAGIIGDLEGFGCPVIMVTQSARNLNDATVAFQLRTKSHAIEYDERNELLTWSFTNAAIVRNSFGEIKIDKKPGAKYKRIDPCDATIDAYVVMLISDGKTDAAVNVNKALDSYLANMGWL